MNRNTVRLTLAAVASFYVVVGGLWALDYFPLQKFYAQSEIRDALIEEHGYSAAYELEEYREAGAYEQVYALSHPDILATESKLDLLQSLLLWATVALAVAGGVLLLTRRKARGPASTSAPD